MILNLYNWDLIQIVQSYQGLLRPWYNDDLIRVATVCHERNLFKGSWGYGASERAVEEILQQMSKLAG